MRPRRLGPAATALSNRIIFFAAALLAVPALVALTRIRSAEVDYGRSVGVPDHHKQTTPTRARRAMLWTDRSLVTFATCLFLFQMANASILPLIGGTLSHHVGRYSSLAGLET